jgi:hypothetical protein
MRVCGFQVEAADGRAGELGEFDGAEFGLVDRAAGAVGGEDGWGAFVEDAAQAEEALTAAAGAGAAHRAVAEESCRVRVISSPSKLWLMRMVAWVLR